MLQILLDSYTLHSLLTVVPCRTKTPLAGLGSPGIRLEGYNRPGEHGYTVAHHLYGQRIITLQGVIKGADAASYAANRQALEQAVSLQLDANNVPVPRLLQLTDLNYGLWQVPVTTQAFHCEQENPTFAKWLLNLTTTSYVIEAATASSASLSLPLSGGIHFPVLFPVRFGAGAGGSATAVNTGTAPAKPLLTIAGPCSNPTLYNDATGEKLGFALTLLAGDVLTIDCAARTVVQGSNTNKMAALTTGSKFWGLNPGSSTLRFTADAYDAGSATVTWHSAYIGI